MTTLPEVPCRQARPALALALAVMLIIGLAWALTGGLVGSGSTDSGGTTGAVPVSMRSYVVRPGETLWTIAERLDPGADPRPLVDRLAAQVNGPVLQAGQRLVLPTTRP